MTTVAINTKARVTPEGLAVVISELRGHQIGIRHLKTFFEYANHLLRISEKQLKTPYDEARAEVAYCNKTFTFTRLKESTNARPRKRAKRHKSNSR